MPTVKMTLRLTNATDEALVRRGRIACDQIHSCLVDAVIDGDSISTVIPLATMQNLGLLPVRWQSIKCADGQEKSVPVAEPMAISLLGRNTFDEAFVLGDEIRIGQPVLRKTDLVIDYENEQVIPNPGHAGQWLTEIK